MADRKVAFSSFFGFATTSAKDGERVAVAYQINCKDTHFENSGNVRVHNMLDDFAYPEVIRRIKDGKLVPEFRLQKVHILMYADETRNEILLNDEVRFKMNVTFVDGKKFKPGEPVNEPDIEDIVGIYPNEKNDPNAAHVMLMKFKNNWHFACDLIYDRERVRKRFENARSFLRSAELCKEQKLWGPLVDNLYSCTELSIQSILLLHHNPRFSINQDHEQTRKLFKAHAENGNIDLKYSQHYEKITELRKKVRYLTGVNGKGFTMSETEVENVISTTKELWDETNKLLTSVNFARKPPAGEYVAAGAKY